MSALARNLTLDTPCQAFIERGNIAGMITGGRILRKPAANTVTGSAMAGLREAMAEIKTGKDAGKTFYRHPSLAGGTW